MNRFITLFLFCLISIPNILHAESLPNEWGHKLVSFPLLSLFLIISLGLLLGRIKIFGLSLGSSGVIFSALMAGHLGCNIPSGIGKLGIVLFIYSVGLTAGPSFFRVFRQQGKPLALLAIVLVVSGTLTSWGVSRWLHIPSDISVGLFAGALTSTPGLAAAMEALSDAGQTAVGYGIAYPFGIMGVVLFIQLLPRLLKIDLNSLDQNLQASEKSKREIKRVLVEALNPAVIGKKLVDLDMIAQSNCQITRVLEGDKLIPISKDFTIKKGDLLLLIGRAFRHPPVIALIGAKSDRNDYNLDTEHQRMSVVVTSKNLVGKTIKELRLLGRFGVTISRISRHDLEFVPDLDDVVQFADALRVIGEPDNLKKFADYAGHRSKAFDQTDLISLGMGIIIGILLGSIRFGIGNNQISLGLVGGQMLVALIIGHFGRIGKIDGSLPRASRYFMMELGLVFFLADAGIKAGGSLLHVLSTQGPQLLTAALTVTVLPMGIGFFFAQKILKINILQILGGVCGGMTSTPGLGALTSKTDSEIPVVSYAAAYPVALILMTLASRLLVSILP